MKLNFALALKVLQDAQLLLAHSRLPADFSAAAGLITTHSQAVEAGGVFIAYAGVQQDSHRFIAPALARGAALIIAETPPPSAEEALPSDVVWLQVACGRSAWSFLSDAAAGFPSRRLQFYGVTGTNGKTSTVWMVRALLAACGVKTLSCGTLGLYWGEELLPSPHTTPDPSLFYPMLAKVAAAGGDTVLMEVSSHALVQKKVAPLTFAAAAFTSFSRDHLDFHGDMPSYWQAKWQLFSERLAPQGRAILHANLAQHLPNAAAWPSTPDLWWYSAEETLGALPLQPQLELCSLRYGSHSSHLHLRYGGKDFVGTIPYVGAYNCENFLAAWLLASHRLGAGVPSPLWEALPHVPGRLQPVATTTTTTTSSSGQDEAGPQVFVDYAHTPDALAKSITCLRPLCRGTLWVVFGCGGDRDEGKRPQMGSVAAELADRVVVTSDNPRSEDPEAIIAAIVAGFTGFQPPAAVITAREQAIAYAVTTAAAGDVVLIAGKGHEAYQQIGQQKLPFDDRQVASQYLTRKG